jgi:hypothetical protein
MLTKGLLTGAVIIKNDKVETSEFAEGSGTVATALTLKLRTYLRSLAKKLGQHNAQSYVAIGTKTVVVYLKGRTLESMIFVKKEKFNDAVELWKNKMKLIEGS